MGWFRLGPDGLEPIPYWTETNPEPELLTVWPAAWLEPSTRYVVALRGTPASDSVAFDALRRGMTMGTTLEDRQPAFDEVFLRLEAEGVPAEEVALAWTFATASASNLRARVEAMTSEALKDPVQYTFTSTTFDVERGLFSFEGTFTCAQYLVPAELDGVSLEALADPVSPEPIRVGTTEVPFRLAIPESANNQAAGPTAAVLQLGLPPFEPLQTPTPQALLTLTTFGPYIVGFAPFQGLTDADEPIWRSAAENGGLLQFVGESLLQGVVQQVRFAQVLRVIADSPFVAGNFRVDGRQVHLITEGLVAGPGLAVAGLSSDVGRSVALRPVLDLPFALPRSRGLQALLEGEADSGWDGAYGGPAPAAVVGALARMFLAESGPAAFPEAASNLLVVMAEGDHDASPQDLERWARAVNIPAVAPYAGRAPFGLTLQSPPVNGPGLVLFDFGLPDPPVGPQPPPADSMNPGPGLFEREAVQDLVRRYLREGVIDCAMPPCAFAVSE